MKIIDILNLIANEEWFKIPKNIKYENKYYVFDIRKLDYLLLDETDDSYLFEYTLFTKNLNDNVEVLKNNILNSKEKEYLYNVIKPFINKVEYICKYPSDDNQYITIFVDNEVIDLPYFKKDTMYINMKEFYKYTIEELDI